MVVTESDIPCMYYKRASWQKEAFSRSYGAATYNIYFLPPNLLAKLIGETQLLGKTVPAYLLPFTLLVLQRQVDFVGVAVRTLLFEEQSTIPLKARYKLQGARDFLNILQEGNVLTVGNQVQRLTKRYVVA